MRLRLPAPLASRLARRRGGRHAERGQVFPLLVGACFAMFGMAALAVDVGYWRYQQRLEQSAADAAAIAGAIELLHSTTAANIDTAVRTAAAANGFNTGTGLPQCSAGNTVCVYVYTPAQSGKYSGAAYTDVAVEAVISAVQPRFFAGVGGLAAPTIKASAVALTNLQSTADNCLTVLNGNITITGNDNISAPNCGIDTNGALDVTGNATITAKYVYDVSGADLTGNVTVTPSAASTIATTDPCVTIPSCADFVTDLAASAYPGETGSYTATTASPGVFTTTFTVTGNNTIAFSPGVYILDAGMTLTGNVTLTGSGVVLYLLGGSITGTGNISIRLEPPTSGLGAGISIYQPASNTSALSVTGNGGVGLDGLIYAPTAALTFTGNSSDTQSSVIVGSVDFTGNSTLTVNNTSTLGQELSPGHVVLAQ